MNRETEIPTVVDASFIAGAQTFEQLPPPTHMEVAFAGRSNVGKSSLINALLNRRNLVRTSNTPGCTRAINIFRVTLHEPALHFDLVDLPGYGYAQRSKQERLQWATMIEDFLTRRAGLKGVFVLVDARRGVQGEDEQLLHFAAAQNLSAQVVITKTDKIPNSKVRSHIENVKKRSGLDVLATSAKKREGLHQLWNIIMR